MPDTATRAPYALETREFSFRAKSVDADAGIVRGVAVPYNSPVRIRDFFEEYEEQFAPGSVDDDGALAFWRHQDPIGFLVEATDTDTGREVALRISDTALGRDALTLARDLHRGGRPMQLSVGFEPGGDHTVEERDGDVPLVTRTRVRVREVSLVPFGAYDEGATVTEVRERPNPTQKENIMPTEATETSPDLIEVRESVEELERRLATFQPREETPAIDTRSAGAFLYDLANGDEATVRAYNDLQARIFEETLAREYSGGTSADAPMQNQWVGDLTRIFDASSGVHAQVFATGTLPSKGNVVEFAELLTNTVQVTEQEDEGDDLAYGKVTLQTRTAPVKTYGGYVQLTRQAIERSTLPVLNRSLEALAQAAGARKKAVLRAAFNSVVTERRNIASDGGVVVLGATLAAAEAGHWEDVLIDAAIKYEAENASPEALIVSAAVFKALRALTVEGERVLTVDRGNHSGSLNLRGLTANLAGLPVYLDTGAAGTSAVFANGRAIRQYDSAVVSLQDENVINLSKDFSVYRYGAVAPEIPQFIVPVKIATS